jgi:dimethylargininase
VNAVSPAREGLSYRFRSAIVRLPGRSVVNGLRDVDRGEPDFTTYLAEHAHYRAALQEAGVEVHVLPALEAFPDSVFVEDTALCLPQGVIILRPGAPSRRGEADAMAEDCTRLGLPVRRLGDGSVDGGDILVTDREILVGVSARTSPEGFDQLSAIVRNWGYPVRRVLTPRQVLHFKSDCSVLGPDTILATSRLASEPCFSDYDVLVVPQGEEAAANSIRVNDTVLVPAGYPATAGLIEDAGFTVRAVPATQAALLDGGLSCQSLRY